LLKLALGTRAELGHIYYMKLNSPDSIKEAAKVFRNYGGSWTAARAAGQRDEDGVLVIPVQPARDDKNSRRYEVSARGGRKAG
jgi:hypothetical protein